MFSQLSQNTSSFNELLLSTTAKLKGCSCSSLQIIFFSLLPFIWKTKLLCPSAAFEPVICHGCNSATRRGLSKKRTQCTSLVPSFYSVRVQLHCCNHEAIPTRLIFYPVVICHLCNMKFCSLRATLHVCITNVMHGIVKISSFFSKWKKA